MSALLEGNVRKRKFHAMSDESSSVFLSFFLGTVISPSGTSQIPSQSCAHVCVVQLSVLIFPVPISTEGLIQRFTLLFLTLPLQTVLWALLQFLCS